MEIRKKSTSRRARAGFGFAIGWKGKHSIDREAFVDTDRDSGRVVTILGYPVRRIAEWGDRKISNMFG
jgi:hypothetical protein